MEALRCRFTAGFPILPSAPNCTTRSVTRSVRSWATRRSSNWSRRAPCRAPAAANSAGPRPRNSTSRARLSRSGWRRRFADPAHGLETKLDWFTQRRREEKERRGGVALAAKPLSNFQPCPWRSNALKVACGGLPDLSAPPLSAPRLCVNYSGPLAQNTH